jgi:RNA polymerase sigma factor for flagellar operon FliA
VPRLVRLKAHQLSKAYKSLEIELGREPTDFEMAEKMGVSIDELSGMVDEAAVCNIFSLSEKWDENEDDDSLEKIEMLEDKQSLDPIETLNQKDVLRAITRSLTKKEKLIIIMYYYEGLTMREIGDILSLTESRVCQIRSNVMAKLKIQLDKMRKKLVL